MFQKDVLFARIDKSSAFSLSGNIMQEYYIYFSVQKRDGAIIPCVANLADEENSLSAKSL